jgi:polyisoprenoid-binding protein YceI
MTAATTPQPSATTAKPRRRRRWLRWTIIAIAALVVLLVGLVAAGVALQPTPAPLALPPNAAAPAGAVDGTYQASSASVAGFRIQQTVLGITGEVVGRTGDVTGAVTIANGQVSDAHLRAGLLALTSGGTEPAPQFGTSLETARYPAATMVLTQPIALDAAFAAGTPVTVRATGTLTLHGVTRTVTATLALRRNAAKIEAAGTVPVSFADYGIAGPQGYGPLGSLADHGTAEFLLVLPRS